jgi:hypothetical protein
MRSVSSVGTCRSDKQTGFHVMDGESSLSETKAVFQSWLVEGPKRQKRVHSRTLTRVLSNLSFSKLATTKLSPVVSG